MSEHDADRHKHESDFEAWWTATGPLLINQPVRTVKGVARVAFFASRGVFLGITVSTSEFTLETEPVPFSQQVVALWNEIVTAPLPKARWSADRGKKIDARRRSMPALKNWRLAITELNATDYCRGEAKSSQHPNWKASLAWFVKNDENALRFLEAANAKRVMRTNERVANCRHSPACVTPSQCTDRLLKEME